MSNYVKIIENNKLIAIDLDKVTHFEYFETDVITKLIIYFGTGKYSIASNRDKSYANLYMCKEKLTELYKEILDFTK